MSNDTMLTGEPVFTSASVGIPSKYIVRLAGWGWSQYRTWLVVLVEIPNSLIIACDTASPTTSRVASPPDGCGFGASPVPASSAWSMDTSGLCGVFLLSSGCLPCASFGAPRPRRGHYQAKCPVAPQ